MKLLSHKKVINENVTLEFCREFLPSCITKFVSITEEIDASLIRWFSKNHDANFSMTKFKRALVKLYYENCSNSFLILEWWTIRGWKEEDAKQIIASYQSATRNKNIENIAKKVGSIDEAKKIIKSRDKKASFWCVEFWIEKGLSLEDAKHKVSAAQSRVKTEETKEKIRTSSKRSIDYWINQGFPINEARQKLKEHQTTFSLEKCKEKYGDVAGLKRWQDRQEKWHSNYKKSNYSQISQKLFKELVKYADDCIFAERFNSGTNDEYIFKTLNGSIYKLDFWVPSSKKIIEFDGDYWHRKDSIANVGREEKRTQQILETDPDIKIMRVREFDFRKEPQEVLAKCKNFLLNNETN